MSSNLAEQASLILNDGTIYKGKLFGAAECVAGEVGRSKLLLTRNITSRFQYIPPVRIEATGFLLADLFRIYFVLMLFI